MIGMVDITKPIIMTITTFKTLMQSTRFYAILWAS